jgi:amidase
VKARDNEIHAWAYLDVQEVLTKAKELDELSSDQRGPLHGLAVGIKDIFLTKGTYLACYLPLLTAR